MTDIQIKEDFLHTHTHVPNSFIDDFMPSAEPLYCLIFIYLLRQNESGGTADAAAVAKVFDITERKSLKALRYLESEGLITLNGATAPKAPVIAAANTAAPEEPLITANLSAPEKIRNLPAVKQTPEKDETAAKAPVQLRLALKPILEQERPIYSPEEIEAYSQQEIIADLFVFAQERLSRMLRHNDLNMLYGMYDWLRLDIGVIKRLIEYCAENGHTNLSYIEAVALDWAGRGIKTADEAEDYIQTFTKTYREILKAMGITGRTPIPKETEYMEKWLNEYKMPLEIILEACDKTIMTIGKSNFKYTNTIIECWYKAGVKTTDDMIKAEDAFSKERAQKPDAPRPRAGRKSKFANFEGRKIDYIEIEKLEQEYIDSIVKGQ